MCIDPTMRMLQITINVARFSSLWAILLVFTAIQLPALIPWSQNYISFQNWSEIIVNIREHSRQLVSTTEVQLTSITMCNRAILIKFNLLQQSPWYTYIETPTLFKYRNKINVILQVQYIHVMLKEAREKILKLLQSHSQTPAEERPL